MSSEFVPLVFLCNLHVDIILSDRLVRLYNGYMYTFYHDEVERDMRISDRRKSESFFTEVKS